MVEEERQKFWVRDPEILVTDLALTPTSKMSRNEKLNALTRFVIVLAVVLYFLGYDIWWTFLLVSIIVILLLKCALGKKDVKTTEGFTVTPTYNSLDFEQTSVAPLFAEEWQIYPPAYDLYENEGNPNATFMEPDKPQLYPYGQYLTRTNLLPGDEFATHMMNGGTQNAREYANSAFTRHSIAFRDQQSRLIKKIMARRYRNSNLNDSFSPFTSY